MKKDSKNTRRPGKLSISQHVLCSLNVGRKTASNFEFENSECYRYPTFQDRDVLFNLKCNKEGRMGDFSEL